MTDELFPGMEDLKITSQELLLKVAEETGIIVRQRCANPEAASTGQCRWVDGPILASIKGTLPGLSESKVKEIYKKALDIWNSCCNVQLKWTDDFNAANIWAQCQKIDGATGTLAWSFLIQCGGSVRRDRLEQRYDNQEAWTENWFLEVCLHEIGHALGLNHSTQKGALMYPYSAGGALLRPTQYELTIMVPLYGPPIILTPQPEIPRIIGGVLLLNNGEGVEINDQDDSFVYGGKTYHLKVTS